MGYIIQVNSADRPLAEQKKDSKKVRGGYVHVIPAGYII
jgi:hypothetical protein